MPKWTEQQRDAIADRGHSLIVCAAAGSGKTAVLVERIVQLVREGCPIENMLVVTFTNAAAGEMRQRIGEALGKAAREDPALGEQVMALSRASISTLHRFCGNLLREPISGLPVILLRPGVLPGGEPLTLERPGQRVIPFSSAGGSDILIGFRADSITLKTLTRKKDIQAYLAFDKAGNGFAGTDGLFPASLL